MACYGNSDILIGGISYYSSSRHTLGEDFIERAVESNPLLSQEEKQPIRTNCVSHNYDTEENESNTSSS